MFFKRFYLLLKLKDKCNLNAKTIWVTELCLRNKLDLNVNFRPFWNVTVVIAIDETLHSFILFDEVGICNFLSFE